MGLPNQSSLYIQSVALLFYPQSTVCNGRVIIKTATAKTPNQFATVAASIFYRCLEHERHVCDVVLTVSSNGLLFPLWTHSPKVKRSCM